MFVFSANPVRPCKSCASLQSQYMEVIGSVYHLHGKVYVICGKISTCRNQKSLKWFVVRSLSAGKGSPVIDLVRRWREIFNPIKNHSNPSAKLPVPYTKICLSNSFQEEKENTNFTVKHKSDLWHKVIFSLCY